jgi:2-methylcitrate dehydratase PrpD
MTLPIALTNILARECVERTFNTLPADIVAIAQQCLLDWLGVAMLGSQEPLVNILIDEAIESGGEGSCPLIGRSIKLGMLDTALINGAAAHALDYDDGNRAGGHLSAPIASALMALAYQLNADGRDVVTAFVAGYELCARIGHLLLPDHYARGFHATATLGTFGATAACARLLGLNAEQTAIALGIAATEAAGLIANFGTMCKPFHVGQAARNGLLAARLARRGFTARADLLEHTYGFAKSHSDDYRVEAALAEPPGGFHLRANVFKFHAACAGTHSTIEALNTLRIEHNIQPDQIARVVVHMAPNLDRVCNIAEPRSGLEIKFSLRMTAALALAGYDTSDPALFTDTTAQQPDLIALRNRIVINPSEEIASLATKVEVQLANAQVFTATRAADLPESDIATQGSKVANKFRGLTKPLVGALQSEALVHGLNTLSEQSSLRKLLDTAVAS